MAGSFVCGNKCRPCRILPNQIFSALKGKRSAASQCVNVQCRAGVGSQSKNLICFLERFIRLIVFWECFWCTWISFQILHHSQEGFPSLVTGEPQQSIRWRQQYCLAVLMQTVALEYLAVTKRDYVAVVCAGASQRESPGFGSSPKPSTNFWISKVTINLPSLLRVLRVDLLDNLRKSPHIESGPWLENLFHSFREHLTLSVFPPTLHFGKLVGKLKQLLHSTRKPVFKLTLISHVVHLFEYWPISCKSSLVHHILKEVRNCVLITLICSSCSRFLDT